MSVNKKRYHQLFPSLRLLRHRYEVVLCSVEAVSRGLDPLKCRLLVADPTRSDATICLAVSPALKEIGVPFRPRLFEAKRAIKDYKTRTHTTVNYITAIPRMALYEQVSAQIYSILLRYAAPENIHVYSVDESFIYCTPYLSFYQTEAEKQGVHPVHVMAMTRIACSVTYFYLVNVKKTPP